MKSDLTAVAEHYAQAVFELAEKDGKVERVLNDISLINLTLSSDPEASRLLRHPGVPATEKKAAFAEVVKTKKLDDLVGRLIDMLCDRRRLEILPALEKAYKDLLRERKGIVVGTIVSAEPLDDTQRAHLETRLRQKLGKQLELQMEVDESLIGGFMLKIGDQVIDGSLKGRLQAVERSLLSV